MTGLVQGVGDALLLLVGLSALVWCGRYARAAPWARSAMGRNLMGLGAAIAGLGCLGAMRALVDHDAMDAAWPWVRAVLFLAVLVVLVDRHRLLSSAQPRRTDE